MITSCTLENENIQAFTNDTIYTMKMNIKFSSVENVFIFYGVNVVIFEGLDAIIFECRGCYHFVW